MYEILVMSEVLEHVLEPSQLLENLARRLKPNAYLILTAPNGWGPWEVANRLDPRNRLARSYLVRRLRGRPAYVAGAGPDHSQFFTRRALMDLAGAASFQLLRSGNSDGALAVSKRLSAHTRLARADCRLADVLPDGLASGWYFLFEAPPDC